MVKQKPAEEEASKTSGRSFWSGTITFGLVTVPVDFYAANRARAGRLFLVTEGGDRVGRRYVCPAHDQMLSSEEIVRGYEVESGKFVTLTDEELEAAQPERTRDIELVSFVRIDEIPALAFRRSYFLVPSGKSTKAYALLAEAMQESGRAGIGTFVMRGKGYVVAIFAEVGVLRAETLRFKSELRDPETVGLGQLAKPKTGAVAQMTRAIEALRKDDVDPAELVDAHAAGLERLAREKLARDEDVVRLEDDPALAQREARRTALDLFELLEERLGRGEVPQGAPANENGEPPGNGEPHRAPNRKNGGAKLRDLAKRELYQQAKELGIEGRSQMTKDALVEAIRAVGGA